MSEYVNDRIIFNRWKNNDKFIINILLDGVNHKIVIIKGENITINTDDNSKSIITLLEPSLKTIFKPEIINGFTFVRNNAYKDLYTLCIIFNLNNNIKLFISGNIVSELLINEDGYSTVTLDMCNSDKETI